MSPVIKALAIAIAAYTAFTGCVGTFFIFTHEAPGTGGGLRNTDLKLSLRANQKDALLSGIAVALAVDDTVEKGQREKGQKPIVCIDRYAALQNAYTMEELFQDWESIQRKLPHEIKQLKTKRYFLTALLHNNAEVFGFWQRELFKVIFMLGNKRFDNVFVSVYESGSSDMTKVCLVGLSRLLDALNVPHRIITDEPLSGMTRIEHLALLRNLALEPIFNVQESYDQVVYLNDIYFCSSDIIDLVRVVHEKGADMTCSVDYINRDPGMQGQDDIRLYDMWVAHDIKGQNFVNDWPYMCDIESQAKFDNFQPVRVFSCWNGMVAIQADVFQKLGIRFRAAHQFECKLSECDIVVRDMWAKGRNKIVMVPTARTAYSPTVFSALLERENPGLGSTYNLDLSGLESPKEATCCPLNDLFHLVRFEECFSDENWRLAYDTLGVALAPNSTALSAKISVPADVPSLVTHLHNKQSPQERRFCADFTARSKIPPRVVHFAGDPGPTNHDRKNKLAMAALSWVARHPCFTYDMMDDARLEALATENFNRETSRLGKVANIGIKIDFMRLLYIYEHGGLYVPANSWALDSLMNIVTPSDKFVLGMATERNTNTTYMAFIATEQHSAVIRDVLTGALDLLENPRQLAELIRSDLLGGPADTRERFHVTGMGMLLRKISKFASLGARFINYDTTTIEGYVGRPENLCEEMKSVEESGPVKRGPLALRTKGTDGSGSTERDSGVGLLRSVSFSVLRVGRTLFQGQYLPSFFGEDPKGVEPSWITPYITVAELRKAGLTETPQAVFAYLDWEGEFGIWAGYGPLDKNARLLRNIAKAHPGLDPTACTMIHLVLQDDSNLVLYCEAIDERARSRLSVLWASGAKLAAEYRGARQSFIMMRRDGRLALYPGLHPDRWGYDLPSGPLWAADVQIVSEAHNSANDPVSEDAPNDAAMMWAEAAAKEAKASPDSCEDFHVKCELWIRLDECTTNRDFMMHMCKKGCNLCTPAGSDHNNNNGNGDSLANDRGGVQSHSNDAAALPPGDGAKANGNILQGLLPPADSRDANTAAAAAAAAAAGPAHDPRAVAAFGAIKPADLVRLDRGKGEAEAASLSDSETDDVSGTGEKKSDRRAPGALNEGEAWPYQFDGQPAPRNQRNEAGSAGYQQQQDEPLPPPRPSIGALDLPSGNAEQQLLPPNFEGAAAGHVKLPQVLGDLLVPGAAAAALAADEAVHAANRRRLSSELPLSQEIAGLAGGERRLALAAQESGAQQQEVASFEEQDQQRRRQQQPAAASMGTSSEATSVRWNAEPADAGAVVGESRNA